MENLSTEEFKKQREKYENTKNVIKHLEEWKEELEDKISKNAQDATSHGLVSEIELAVVRLKLLAGTEVYSQQAKLRRLEFTADDYDYRLMCEWGYKNREKWQDAREKTKKIEVNAGDYIINM
ncbi:MAG: hypothetical protein OQK04_12295 [Kangiellaceae bacterium]|nr:hypothetical protein [Kangiellaceae bacterium]MCW8999481.1 hypothetical protein [Kangiellaceae bacterium]